MQVPIQPKILLCVMLSLNARNVFFIQKCNSWVEFWGFLRSDNFSSLSSLSSKLFYNNDSKPLAKDPNADFLIKKIGKGCSHDEVFSRLSADADSQKVPLSSELVMLLLNRFNSNWNSALGVFKWAGSRLGYENMLKACDLMVDILGKMKQMDQMKALLTEIHQHNLVSLTTVGKAMRRLSGAGQWKEAVKLFDELKAFGLTKNIDSMNLLLDTLCKEGKVVQARNVFLELKSHIPPDARTFNILIHGWCKISRVDEAEWTLREMKGYGCNPSVISYSIIIHQYCRANEFDKAFALLDEMEKRKIPVSVITYTIILSSLTKKGELDQALDLVEKMKNSGCKLDILFYNSLIHTMGKAGRINQAVHIFQVEMPCSKIVPNTSTFNTMVAMFCHQGDIESAMNLIEQMKSSNLCEPDNQTFFPLLKLCFRVGKTDYLLMKLVNDMVYTHHLSLDLSTYMLLIHGLCRANKCEWAYQLFEDLIGEDIKPNHKTCCMLLQAVRLKNMYDAAEKIEFVMKKYYSGT